MSDQADLDQAKLRGGLLAAAAEVLRRNDRGTRTVAAPHLYPHQWSWDAAFVAVGWSKVSVSRALVELEALLQGQWATGMIPHIVFSEAPGYFPGPERWRTDSAVLGPRNVGTSGICQPSVHGIALYVIHQQALANGGTDAEESEAFLGATFDSWYRWHRWLSDVRGADGLIEIHHSWESGMDNSPRWDESYARVVVGEMAPYTRVDTRHVASAAQRPSDVEYSRYLWLVEQLVSVNYDDVAAREAIDFRVGDVFFTGIHALSSELLAELGDSLGHHDQAGELRAMAALFRRRVAESICPESGLARDFDFRQKAWLSAETLGGFAPLIAGVEPTQYAALLELFAGERFCGNPLLRWPLPPTTSPLSPEFVSNNYWRGPQWPVISWLFSWAIARHGHEAEAEALREAGLDQLSDLTFAEYYDSVDGSALGSSDQSWTAAAALAWLVRPRRTAP